MNPRDIDDILSGRRRDLFAHSLRAGATFAEPFYRLGLNLHQSLYRCGLKSRHAVDVPVVSIGNLTTGGTGKTPFTARLVKLLIEQGMIPGIASRGYRALKSEDSHSIPANDEKLVLDLMCPRTPHRQNRDRVTAAQDLIIDHADIILIDDGYQHLRLKRDVDLVLIDAVNPFGYNHLLPRGLLREPLNALKRAHLIVITRTDQITQDQLAGIEHEVRRYTYVPIVHVHFAPTGWQDHRGNTVPISESHQSAVAFCGIGNPEGFRQGLTKLGLELNDQNWLVFPDHHHYTQDDLNQLAEVAKEHANGRLVTTLKDLVKIRDLIPQGITCQALLIEAVIDSGEDVLIKTIQSKIKREPQMDADGRR
ncbi:tetraacyldisaccharide 4'-kinase [uncultured Rubinisphaera sp.]|uniref:tetraacyldisaccharide 4'-kinase n=1 Tax=uncultured Rubinisphaera sp. TaxID=1678686 RepID=UPI0030D8FD48